MNVIKKYKAECILISMMVWEGSIWTLKPTIPHGVEEFILLILLIAYVACVVQRFEQGLKRKWRLSR